jgi:hypothetical protein
LLATLQSSLQVHKDQQQTNDQHSGCGGGEAATVQFASASCQCRSYPRFLRKPAPCGSMHPLRFHAPFACKLCCALHRILVWSLQRVHAGATYFFSMRLSVPCPVVRHAAWHGASCLKDIVERCLSSLHSQQLPHGQCCAAVPTPPGHQLPLFWAGDTLSRRAELSMEARSTTCKAVNAVIRYGVAG